MAWIRKMEHDVHYFTSNQKDLGGRIYWVAYVGGRVISIHLDYGDEEVCWYLTPMGDNLSPSMEKLENKWFKKKSAAIHFAKNWMAMHPKG